MLTLLLLATFSHAHSYSGVTNYCARLLARAQASDLNHEKIGTALSDQRFRFLSARPQKALGALEAEAFGLVTPTQPAPDYEFQFTQDGEASLHLRAKADSKQISAIPIPVENVRFALIDVDSVHNALTHALDTETYQIEMRRRLASRVRAIVPLKQVGRQTLALVFHIQPLTEGWVIQDGIDLSLLRACTPLREGPTVLLWDQEPHCLVSLGKLQAGP